MAGLRAGRSKALSTRPAAPMPIFGETERAFSEISLNQVTVFRL
jgi:hypothetical protein